MLQDGSLLNQEVDDPYSSLLSIGVSDNFKWNILDVFYYYDVCNSNSEGDFEYLYESFVLVWSNIWFHYEWHHNLFCFIWLEWWIYLWNIIVCLICKFSKSCNLSFGEQIIFPT